MAQGNCPIASIILDVNANGSLQRKACTHSGARQCVTWDDCDSPFCGCAGETGSVDILLPLFEHVQRFARPRTHCTCQATVVIADTSHHNMLSTGWIYLNVTSMGRCCPHLLYCAGEDLHAGLIRWASLTGTRYVTC
jgi:hypothetical protein